MLKEGNVVKKDGSEPKRLPLSIVLEVEMQIIMNIAQGFAALAH